MTIDDVSDAREVSGTEKPGQPPSTGAQDQPVRQRNAISADTRKSSG